MNKATKMSALIIGGSSGMGLATAVLLAEKGVSLILLGNQTSKLNDAKHSILAQQADAEVTTWQADLYKEQDVERVIATIAEHQTSINYLVNAAGTFKPLAFLEHQRKDYRAYADLNEASFFITQLSLRICGHMAAVRS